MTLREVVAALEGAALAQPSVKTVVPQDIFRLSAMPSARYGVFGWTQGLHVQQAGSPLVTYAFTLFYVDRLTTDRANELEIQSVGVDTLADILRAVEGDGRLFIANSVTYQTFNQRFADECAGVFANVYIGAAQSTVCAENS